jgi:aminoacylase
MEEKLSYYTSLFVEFLKIKSVHPKPDYSNIILFYKKLANEFELNFKIIELIKGKPIIIISWPGSNPNLPSILLNSHSDVVPVNQEMWKYDAFETFKDSQGNIYGRGTQDMKSVAIQHIIAVGNLKKKFKENGKNQCLRTIYITSVPDEEIGGIDGMAKFVDSEEFQNMNVGFTLDEGLASPDDSFTVFYGERVAWWVLIKAKGPTGHGSRFIENTAVEKLMKVVQKMLHFRENQFKELQMGMAKCGMKLGDVITLNLTILKAGVTTDGETFSLNVIPSEAMAGFDIRIPPSVNLNEFENQLKEWTAEEGVTYEFVKGNYQMNNPVTDISNESYWWKAFKCSTDKLNLKLDIQIFPAATDSRYIRNRGIPAIGFSPMNHTPILLHDHNEFLNEKIFLKGIEIFEKLIEDLANYL